MSNPQLDEYTLGGDTVTVSTPICFVCGEKSFIKVRRSDLERYKNGDLIQHAFPEMLPQDREMLISGTHPDCFDQLFPEED